MNSKAVLLGGGLDLALSTKPEELTFAQCVQLLHGDDGYDKARAYFDGDHWQDGLGWIGPTTDAKGSSEKTVMNEIETAFVTHPAIEEVVERHRDAVIGGEPKWNLAVIRPLAEGEEPNDTEKRLIDEATMSLTTWWDEKQALKTIQEATDDMLLGGRGILRLMVPESELIVGADPNQGVIPDGPLDQQLARIYPLYARANQADVIIDPLSMRKIGIFVYEVRDAITGVPTQLAEITYLDLRGNTVIRTVGITQENDGKEPTPVQSSEANMDLAHNLTIYKMENKRLITNPVLSNQRLLNMQLTMMGINAVLGGFLERVILNGQMPGENVTNVDGTKTFVPARMKVGAGATNWIQGTVVGYDDQKNPIISNPDIRWRDPVDPEVFIKGIESSYTTILHGCRQLHIVLTGNAGGSGEAQKQARADYAKSLRTTKGRIDAAGKWELETALWQASVFAKDPLRYRGLRVVFESQVDTGPLAADERTAMQNEVTLHLRSRENYIQLAHVSEDPPAEKKQILAEVNDPNAPENIVLQKAAQLAKDNAKPGTNVPGQQNNHGLPSGTTNPAGGDITGAGAVN